MPLPITDRWRRGQVKNLAEVTLGKMLQSSDTGDDVQANYMRAANVQPDGVLRLDPKQMWFKPSELEGLTLRRGDVVVVEGGVGGFGRAAYLPDDLDGWGFQNSINRLRPTAATDGRFLAYYLIALRVSGFIERYCNVVSMPHLTAEKLAALPVPIPGGGEQSAVADFLDRETAQIDTLIEEQRRLIDLLRERRAAAIESTLAAAPTAGTGQRLKHLVIEVRQGWSPQCYPWPADGVTTWAVLKAGAANGGVFRPDENKELPDSEVPRPETVVRRGQLVVSRANTRELAGSAAVVEGDYPRLMLSDKLYGFSLNPDLAVPTYVAAVLGTRRWRGLIELEASGSSPSMQNISQADILNLPMDLPGVDEQHRIMAYLDEQTLKIDTLIAETERFIEIARERRSALITAAVTGQIDVRAEVA